MIKDPALTKMIALAGIGMFISGLLFYSIASLVEVSKREVELQHFVKTVQGLLEHASHQYSQLNPDQGSVDLEKEIVKSILSAKDLLDAQYDPNSTVVKIVSNSEEPKIFLKLAIVELESLTRSFQLKTTPDFEKAQKSFQDFVNLMTESNQGHNRLTKSIAWTSITIVFLGCIALALFEFRQTRQEQANLLVTETSLQEERSRVDKLSGFIEAISNGNYSIDLTSRGQDDLNLKLVAMRDKLKKNAEDDQQRNWASAGLAQSGEILRVNTSSLELYDNIIRFVVKYTHSNQGGLFVLSDDEQSKQLELVACYAYERKKFLNRSVEMGQGLIGQCFLEKEMVHLTEIPSDYVNITSGLGGANPSSLILMPLKLNDVVYGVLELASFTAYREFEIEWIERLTESIASTIASVRTNESTRLLLERTQQQAEEMKSQEEEMRQNMEELSTTQEEMSRKEREYIARIKALEESAGVLVN